MTALTIWDIPGGIHPPERKDLSNRTPIQPAPLPRRLVLPLSQHLGAPAEPCVAVGERVLKGQKIAEAQGTVSVPLHAPTSGTVSFIGPQPYPHASGMTAPAIVIDSDGQDEWITLQPHPDFRALEPAALLELIREAGINGLGGAGFPTAAKLGARPAEKIHTLIINGTECEPYITADDVLMRERAAELVSGIDILAHLLQPQTVLIGIEDNKPEAIAAVRAALGERPYVLKVFPTKYPSGGEKQLIQILTGCEVPSGGLPADIGMLCQNVGTCVAIHDAVIHGKPMISRITTLTGEALERPMNVEALLGTPVSDLLAFAGLREGQLHRLIMGGPMMGFTLPDLSVPVIKTTNCLLAATAAELPPPPPALPCIRCGECAEACPASLLPQQLLSLPWATITSSCAPTTCSTASSAAPAPTSARPASRWCSISAPPRARSASWSRSSRRPSIRACASSSARNACAAPRNRRKPNARPAPNAPPGPRLPRPPRRPSRLRRRTWKPAKPSSA